MPKPTGPTNPIVKSLIEDIRKLGYKENSKFLISLAKRLNKPRRIRPSVNLAKINRYSREGETVVVPGKVLSYGSLKKKLTIAALDFSKAAEEKIKKSGGMAILIEELVKENPKGNNTRIIA